MDRDELRAWVASKMVENPRMFQGFAASGGRRVRWQDTATSPEGHADKDRASVADLHADLPEVRKRTPQERLKEMTDILVSTGVRHGDGTWSFPRSVSRQIAVLIGKSGEFVTEETIERYAAHLLTEAEKQQKKTRPEVKLVHS